MTEKGSKTQKTLKPKAGEGNREDKCGKETSGNVSEFPSIMNDLDKEQI